MKDYLEQLLPIQKRVSCAQALEIFYPRLNQVAPEPEEGWLSCAYQTALRLLYPEYPEYPEKKSTFPITTAQKTGALEFLQFLQLVFDEERKSLPFDFWRDFAFCTDEELSDSGAVEEYRRFEKYLRQEFFYELLRLSREVTPFQTLEHITGVHHVAMTVARAFKAGGGLIDLPLISGAALGHDIGKFGCKPGERVPYLHYYYTNQWFTRRGLTNMGHIAANHSVWDLEIENLSSESLTLVYADFRVKQTYDEQGRETACLFSLQDAFDIILSKLDNLDDNKRRRYQYVYAKLRDFEEYMISFGVDTTLQTTGTSPLPRQDPALLRPDDVVVALRRMAVDHNIRLMHRLGREPLFLGILESARSQKDPVQVRAYVSVFEEYFTYWSAAQKELTLEFLYELLMSPDGDLRRQAAALIGQILAAYRSGYQKEPPVGSAPDPQESRPFELWAEYLEKLLHPDRRLTARQISMIRFQAKTVLDALLSACTSVDAPRFIQELFQHCRQPSDVDADTAFAFLDTVSSLPIEQISNEQRQMLLEYAACWLHRGGLAQQAAALQLFQRILTAIQDLQDSQIERIRQAVSTVDCSGSIPLLSLQVQLCRDLQANLPTRRWQLDRPDAVSIVFLDNLKSATPWILKALGVVYLLKRVGRADRELHIAAHFSNLLKVSENVVVRRMAGAALLELAPALTPAHRNEIAVELCKALESGQAEISRYVPYYLGRFLLWLEPQELDEQLDQMQRLLSSSGDSVAAAALSTVGALLECFAQYKQRFSEDPEVQEQRWRRMAGLLLKGLASCRRSVRQEALRILGEELFASKTLSYEGKSALFTLMAKKILVLISEQPEPELAFFYTAAALSHIYRFIVKHRIESKCFPFKIPKQVAFFPGTFDPFSLSHRGIVQEILKLGFEVYLAIDEFSWSKKPQPSLLRRQIVSMSVADMFDVYLFPHQIPVNLATPEDLLRLRSVFSGREIYLAVGSDVILNASAYRALPTEGSVHSLNHIIFRRAGNSSHQNSNQNHLISGEIIQLQLPAYLKDISSTRIRENLDLGRDISNLIDPAVQDFIYQNSLYLREPKYKRLIRAGSLELDFLEHPSDRLTSFLAANQLSSLDTRDNILFIRDNRLEQSDKSTDILGIITGRTINSTGLYATLGETNLANEVRRRTAGRIRLLTGLHLYHHRNRQDFQNFKNLEIIETDLAQLLLTESLSRAMGEDCSFALWYADANDMLLNLLERNGFQRIPGPKPLYLVDMRSPAVLIQNIPTVLKAPFSTDRRVLKAIRAAHIQLQKAVARLYPGSLVLSLNAEVIHHQMVRKIVELNGVPVEPTVPRVLGPKMCVPFGKLLRGNIIPNTVTKTVHTDKVFSPDLKTSRIQPFPGYAPLESQIRTVHSFRRPVILVDDLLHSGNRINALAPLFAQEGVEIDQVLVGLLSGRGRDLMADKGMPVDGIYLVPDMRVWFVESTMYPFIGGDAVDYGNRTIQEHGLTPAVNLMLPYAFPRFYQTCERKALFEFSKTCIENSRDILLALETSYRERYARNLTLSRLSEAVILPLSPDKGRCLRYGLHLPASLCLTDELNAFLRMRDFLEA